MLMLQNKFEHTSVMAADYVRILLLIALGFWLCELRAAETKSAAGKAQTEAQASATTSKPRWDNLNQSQQTILAPLSRDWETLDSINKKKWLAIAKRYPGMSAEDQKRAQERMREWAQLSPEQRHIARDSYARFQALPPEKRAAVIQSYQALPDEKKKQLADENSKKTKLVTHKPVKKSLSEQAKQTPSASVPGPAAK